MRDRTWFIEQLRKQLGFLARSCRSFDEGYADETIRVATSLRVLIHDTARSVSLLSQLNARSSLRLLSTVRTVSATAFAFDGLTTFTGSGPRPRLYTPNDSQQIPVNDWWSQVVYVSGSQRISRGQLVLVAANRDGGAHCDPKLSAEYELLQCGLWMEFRDQEPPQGVEGINLLGLRTLGYEVLNSPELLAIASEL